MHVSTRNMESFRSQCFNKQIIFSHLYLFKRSSWKLEGTMLTPGTDIYFDQQQNLDCRWEKLLKYSKHRIIWISTKSDILRLYPLKLSYTSNCKASNLIFLKWLVEIHHENIYQNWYIGMKKKMCVFIFICPLLGKRTH